MFNENQKLKAQIAKIKTEKVDDTPEKAFADILEDEGFVKQLYEKIKVFKKVG